LKAVGPFVVVVTSIYHYSGHATSRQSIADLLGVVGVVAPQSNHQLGKKAISKFV
jgi:hypothetical protein